MKNKYIAIGLVALGMTGCFTGADDTSNASATKKTIPSSAELVFEMPTSLVPGAAKVAAKADESLFDAYKPVPAYIGVAEDARVLVAEIIDNLSQNNVPEEFLVEEDGTRLETKKLDSLGVSWQSVQWTSTPEQKEVRLVLRKSENNYIGHALLASKSEGFMIRVEFAGNADSEEGRAMKVLVLRDLSTLEDIAAPNILVVKSVKKGDKVFVSGSSVHPTFKDEFWFNGKLTPAVYSFIATADLKEETAVLKAAFGPKSEVSKTFLTDHALDKKINENIYNNMMTLLEDDMEARKAIFWSLETEKPLDQASGSYLAIYSNTREASSFTPDEVEKFAEIQLQSETVEPFYQELALFSKAKQPIFLSRGAVILGNKDNVDNQALSVQESDLDEDSQLDPTEAIELEEADLN